MFAFFLTPLVNVAMHHMALMDAFNVAFLLAGCLYWWPMVGLDPIRALEDGLRGKDRQPGPRRAVRSVPGRRDPVSRQHPLPPCTRSRAPHAGGGLLWSATELSTFAGVIPIFLQWIRSDERARADARADARATRRHLANGQETGRWIGRAGLGCPSAARSWARGRPGSSGSGRFSSLATAHGRSHVEGQGGLRARRRPAARRRPG